LISRLPELRTRVVMVLMMLSVTVLGHRRGDGYGKQQDCSKSDGKGLLHRSPFVSKSPRTRCLNI
jgi:hypothetical protein